MRSLILERVARGLIPVATLFALYLLWRGHNLPGGGFIAGLVTAGALMLQALAFGIDQTRSHLFRALRAAPWVGVAIAMVSGLTATLAGDAFLRQYHTHFYVGEHDIHLSTALTFDIGVYLGVVGVVATLAHLFAEGIEE
jgi:multisubunit Na+/H+ antiporter MnhB subunit